MASRPMYAKQPIFDRNLNVMGYELLFRPTDRMTELDGDKATAQVLLNAFTSNDAIINNHELSIFINCTAEWLQRGLPFNRKNVVLEILESIQYTDSLGAAVQQLKAAGYQIALDDYHSGLDTAHLLEYADIVKIDVLELSQRQVLSVLKDLKSKQVVLLAEKVETQKEYEWCRAVGFDLFQGYFFSKPEISTGKAIAPQKLSTLNLLVELQQNEPDIEVISKFLRSDVVLMTKVMRLANSSRYSRQRKISSIKDAVVILGLDLLKKLVVVISLTELNSKTPELVKNVLTIAFAMERYAKSQHIEMPEHWFFVGCLSKIDALFDQPLELILDSISVDESTQSSLMRRHDSAGRALTILEYMVSGDWPSLDDVESVTDDHFNSLLDAENEVDEIFANIIKD